MAVNSKQFTTCQTRGWSVLTFAFRRLRIEFAGVAAHDAVFPNEGVSFITDVLYDFSVFWVILRIPWASAIGHFTRFFTFYNWGIIQNRCFYTLMEKRERAQTTSGNRRRTTTSQRQTKLNCCISHVLKTTQRSSFENSFCLQECAEQLFYYVCLWLQEIQNKRHLLWHLALPLHPVA